MLRAVDVSDVTVYNTIIDNDHIEQVVLFESDEEARHIMSQNVSTFP